MKKYVYDAVRGGGPFVALLFSESLIIVDLSSDCCTMSSWSIVVGSKLGTTNGVTQ